MEKKPTVSDAAKAGSRKEGRRRQEGCGSEENDDEIHPCR